MTPSTFEVMMLTMIMVNIHEVKAKLSEYLEAVGHGERVLICKRNQPVAELRAVERQRTDPRPIGGAGGVEVLPSFFEPLPDDLADAFEGGPSYPMPRARRSRVEEQGGRYGTGRGTPRKP